MLEPVRPQGMNIQEYMSDFFWLQAIIEAVLIMWTIWHISKEVNEYRAFTAEKGRLAGTLAYLANPWNLLDWIRSLALILALLQVNLAVLPPLRPLSPHPYPPSPHLPPPTTPLSPSPDASSSPRLT